ncbi:MAG: glycosyltransferase family 1 protein, partial [Chloroflexi bacterium]|nr:glycosyltransferase family 1 protein [Chloroflexota bacterium]
MDELTTPKLPKRIAKLDELAHNLWWSWCIPARNLYKSLDRPLWKLTGHNPVKLLQQIEPYRLVAAAEEPDFVSSYDKVMSSLAKTMSAADTWFSREYPHLVQKPVAYFSLEFAIHNSLPLYAGGLGVLAGDYCKEASDLGIPMVGVGFMYPQGYVHQHINDDGWQEDMYEQLDFNAAPISLARSTGGEPIKIKVPLDDKSIHVAVWQAKVGNVTLFLLDTNVEENEHQDRELSARLYAGDREMRLAQEILLGIGGVRVLRALEIEPVVWHANEGHTAFMMLERTRELVEKGMTFEQAAAKVR